jgi:hypothetical protein
MSIDRRLQRNTRHARHTTDRLAEAEGERGLELVDGGVLDGHGIELVGHLGPLERLVLVHQVRHRLHRERTKKSEGRERRKQRNERTKSEKDERTTMGDFKVAGRGGRADDKCLFVGREEGGSGDTTAEQGQTEGQPQHCAVKERKERERE